MCDIPVKIPHPSEPCGVKIVDTPAHRCIMNMESYMKDIIIALGKSVYVGGGRGVW